MANKTSTNPIQIDTVTAITIISISNDFHVYKIRWTSGSIADSALVADANGNTIWEAEGRTATADALTDSRPDSDFSGRGFLFNGLKVTTLGSGTIWLYTLEFPPVDGS